MEGPSSSAGPSPPTTPRRTGGLLGWLLSPFLYFADDVVEAYRREPMRGQGLLTNGPSPGVYNSWKGEQSGSSSPSQLNRRQVVMRRGDRPDKMGLVFEKFADSGLYVISSVSPRGLAFGKLKVGDVVQAIDRVPLRGKKRSVVKGLLEGQPGSGIIFDIITVTSSPPPSASSGSPPRHDDRGGLPQRGRGDDGMRKVTLTRAPNDADAGTLAFRGTKRAHTGVGISLFQDQASGKVYISKCSQKGSAYGKLHEDDELFAVDGVAILGKGTNEIIDMIRGPPGTSVTLIVGKAAFQQHKRASPRVDDFYSPARTMGQNRIKAEGRSMSPERRISTSPDRRFASPDRRSPDNPISNPYSRVASPGRRMSDSAKRGSMSPDRRVAARPSAADGPQSPPRDYQQAAAIQKELEVLQARLRNATRGQQQASAKESGGNLARKRI